MLVRAYNPIILESEGELCVPWSLSYVVQPYLQRGKNDVKIDSNSEEILFQVWNVLLINW